MKPVLYFLGSLLASFVFVSCYTYGRATHSIARVLATEVDALEVTPHKHCAYGNPTGFDVSFQGREYKCYTNLEQTEASCKNRD